MEVFNKIMDSTGPNPKLIFQGLTLLGGLIVFIAIIFCLKIRTGKTFRILISKNQKLLIISLIIAFVTIFLIFLLLLLVNTLILHRHRGNWMKHLGYPC